ncbi:type 1 glutamine amidotransferase [Streptomyces sp. DK15]|uniref:type 1 glutamine amidotransferase n=1 Tax=Streptomyces sp. DK15 TaxID=2957499 RepID=UPI0029AECB58|nr:type 1 glutamine amidotransferase [Streptomyces sp. DK15]MDX2394084.1 type 1 glutamine amidotransferase [Streptomyces sp. DK15]
MVLTHVDSEPAGVYGRLLAERGWRVEEVRVASYTDPRPPVSLRGVDALVVMGGPGTVSGLHPGNSGECRLIEEAVLRGIPYWGVCLGAQLLAAATGGACVRGDGPEVGHVPVALTAAGHGDPVLAEWAAVFGGEDGCPTVMAWHSDTFRLPAHAELLAGSARYPHAFRVGSSAYGIQFHLEVTAALARQWLADVSYRQAAEHSLGADRVAAFLAEHERRQAGLEHQARVLMGTWLERVTADLTAAASG